MEVATLLQDPKNWPVYSAETFPTENWRPIEPVLKAVEELLPLGIKVVTTTWGALGSPRAGTPAICRIIAERYKVPTVVHLTIQGKSLPDIEGILRGLALEGVHNILALGGDPPSGQKDAIAPWMRHRYASDLVSQIVHLNEGRWLGPDYDFKKEGVKTRFGIGVAGFPEVHPEEYRDDEGFDTCMARYIDKLKIKIASGAQYIVSQMIFDAEPFLRFRDAAKKAGITVPIVAGVMPFEYWDQVGRFVGDSLRISFPAQVQEALMNASKEDQPRIADEHMGALVERLVDARAAGIHFYCMNRSGPTARILRRLAQ